MNLRHSFIDAPLRAQSAPGLNEFIFCFAEFHNPNVLNVFKLSKINESYFIDLGVALQAGLSAAIFLNFRVATVLKRIFAAIPNAEKTAPLKEARGKTASLKE